MMLVHPWLLERLACPYDGGAIREGPATLVCAACGRHFAVVDGVPVMLRDDVAQTHDAVRDSLAQVQPVVDAATADPDAAPVPAEGPPPATQFRNELAPEIDDYVQEAVSATCGLMYESLVGHLDTYPIPEMRIPPAPGAGRTLVDVGCNWGRWSFAAARAGFTPIGVDPTLGAVRAASRVAKQIGATAHFIAGDARYLPLRDATADITFSYSVLQHLAKHDVRRALREMRRVLAPHGSAIVQMPNALGARSLMVQAKRQFRRASGFEVRYWTIRELRAAFERLIGPTAVSVDGYFSLNPQTVDLSLLPLRYQAVVRTSDALRKASQHLPWLVTLADSLYLSAERSARD
jgi:SAM-dependent methyltransferase